MKYFLCTICFILCISFSKNSFPSRNELVNKWVVEKNIRDASTVYLVNPKLESIKERGDVEFFVNEYTSTLRIKYVEPLGGFPICEHVIRCGTGYLNEERKPHICFDYSKQSLCAYDAEKGLLKIKDSVFLGDTLFQIEQGNFKEIVLKRIK